MHDIDRTQREFEMALQEIQPELFEYGEVNGFGEYQGEGEGEAWEAGVYEAPAFETWQESAYEGEMYEGEAYEAVNSETGLSESEELELAAELLEITSEEELDQFLGKLVRNVGRGIRKAVKSPLGRALGGVLKPLAKAALPIAGRAVGTFFGGPVGGMVGGKLASAAGQMFGLELEGLSAEDREYEVARRYVRFAGATTRNALGAPAANPQATARKAAAIAARRFAPGLNRRRSPASASTAVSAAYGAADAAPAGSRRRGTWIRRGRRIILFGV